MRSTIPATVGFLLASALHAQIVPTGFVVDTLMASGLQDPTDCCFLPDGRVLVTNMAGAVVVYANGSTATIGTVPSVEVDYERGLLSVAADPAFASNGHVFVHYASTADDFLHVDRFTCTGDLADPLSANLQFAASSRCVVLSNLPDNAYNHNGGSLRFGPDGMLYLAVGDDGVACNAQSVTSASGCLLRFDPSALPAGGSVIAPPFDALDPGDNPMSGNSDFTQLVIAHGFRNPFRMEIDPVTGNVYVGDVGGDTEEEYSEYVRPAAGPLPLVNFGWPWREGAIDGSGCGGTAPTGLVEPIVSVSHVDDWFSVMGGARYRNQGAPYDFGAAYEGSAFYLDYFSGEVRRLVNAAGWVPAPAVPGQPTANDWGTGFARTTCLRLGPDGCLWFTQQGGNGSLRRIRANATAPVVFPDGCFPPFALQVGGAFAVGGSIQSSVSAPIPWLCMYGLTRQTLSLTILSAACQCLLGHDVLTFELVAPGASASLPISPAWGPAGYSIHVQACGLAHPAGGPCPDLQLLTSDTVQITID